VNDKIEKFDLIHNPFDVEITDFAGCEKKKKLTDSHVVTV